MAFKATQYQIKNGDKNSSSGAGFKATKYKTYNPDVVRSWETTNKQSLDILNDYNNRINKSEWLDEEDRKKYRSALDTYIETSNNLRGINKMFGEGYTDEDEQKWADSIASMNSGYDEINSFYSQFASDKVYNDWHTTLKADEEYNANFSNIDSSKASQGWEKYLADIEAEKNAPKYDLNKDGKDSWWEKLIGYLGSGGGVVDTSLPTAGVTQTINDLRADQSHLRPNDDWTEEQKNAFGQLYESSKYLAYEFAAETNKRNAKKKEEDAVKKIQDSATSGFWAGLGNTVGAIATAPLGLADYLNDLAYANAGREIAPDGNISPFEYSQAVTSGITEHLNKQSGVLDERIPFIGGKGAGDIYGWASSTVQSIASAYTLGPSGMLVSYFGQGAASAVDESLARGKSEEESVVYGTVVGLIEGIWESIGGERLLRLGAAPSAKSFVRQLANQAAAEGLEGGLTSVSTKIAEDVIDRIYQGDGVTTFDQLVQEYMNSGMSKSEASKRAWLKMGEEIAFDAVSEGVSGGVGGLVQMGVPTARRNAYAKKNYSGQVEGLLVDAANVDGAGKTVDKLVNKYGKNGELSGWDINHLLEITDTAKVKSAVKAQLTKLGERGDVSKIADVIAKQVQGIELSKNEQAILDGSKFGQRIVNTLDRDKIKSGMYDTDWTKGIGTRRLNADVYNKSLSDVVSEAMSANALTTVRENVEAELTKLGEGENASAIAVAMVKKASGAKLSKEESQLIENSKYAAKVEKSYDIGGAVAKAIKSVPESENATVKENATEGKIEASKASLSAVKAVMVDDDGKEVEVKPQRFAPTESGEMGVEIEGGKVVASSEVDFGDSGIGLVRQAAVDMSSRIGGFSVDTANVFVSGYDASSGQSAGAYIDGWVSAYKFGAMKNPPPLSALAANQKTAQLTEEQRKAAYNFGRAFGNEKIVNTVSNNAENISKTDSKKKNGRVIFDGERYGKILNERQRASLKALNFIAEALGIDIYVDKLGKGDNGWYDPSDRSIHVNLEAGVEGEALMLYVASHELTHDIRATLPEKFNTLADAVVEEYNKRFGEHVMEDLIEAKIDFLKEKGDITEDMTEEEAYDLAFEEVICDCLETMLVDSNAMTALSKNIYAKDKRLWQRIKDFFARLVARIRAAYANADPDTEEGQRFRDLGEGAERIKRLWEEAIVELSEVDKTTGEGKVKHSYSSIAYSFFGDENISIKDMESGAYKKTEGYKRYVEQCLNNMRQSVEDFSEKAALKEIRDSIDGIVEVAVAMKKAGYDILDSEGGRNVRDSKKRLLFSSLEPNSDYFTSSDISTICDKRINFAEIYDEIVRREDAMGVPKNKRFFNNIDNYFVLHKILADKGLTAPCRQCYVESMRKNLDPMANAFIELMQEKNPDNKANKQLYQPSGKNKGELKSNNAKLRENLLEVIEREQYDITADDLTIKMLTTADGLAQLKLQAPLIYEAFNSFYGQSKPKMPKAATPFRFGELTALLTDDKGKIKTGLIKQIKSTGGFRLQSYSDFQIQNFADVLQVIFEAGTLGLNGHAYTKVPAFLDATKGTNLKRNISIFMYKDGGQWKIDRGDSFPYELEKIYDIVDADKSGNTSIIAVVQNEDMAAWIMANGNVGYFIPFHKSGVKMGVVRETIVREGGREIKGYSGIKDHTRQQTEVWATTNAEHKANTKVKKGINIYEFWDFDNAENLSQKELIKKNVMAYIDACNEAGYLPKFREYVMDNGKVLNKVLSYAKELGFVSQNATVDDISFEYSGYRIPYGYYKCLGDFGMFTPDGEASPIERLSLKDYKFDEAVEFFSDAESLRRNEILQQFENGFEREKYRKSDMTTAELAEEVQNRRNQVVDEVVSGEYKKVKHSHKAAEKATYARDSQGNELSKEQQEFFKESKARDEEGNLLVLYHGTKAKERITEFLTTEGWRTGLWLTTDHNTGVTFAGGRDDTRLFTKENSSDGAGGRGVYELYANVKNPLIVDAQGKRYWEIPRPSVMGEGKSVSGEEINAYAFENGYDGVIINDVVEGSNRLGTDVIVFKKNQVKYTDNLNPTERNDIRYSHKADKKATYAPTFYSHMGKVIDDIKLEKMGTSSILNHLKNRGVKDEEIKWSGIETFLEGKKSVTKAELQEFVAGSQLNIEEEMSDVTKLVLEDGTAYDSVEKFKEAAYSLADEQGIDRSRVGFENYDDEAYVALVDDDIDFPLLEAAINDGGARWSQYKLGGGTNYRELVFKMPNSTYSNRAMRGHWGQDAEGVLVHARIQDFEVDGKKMLFIEELQSDWHNEGLEKGYSTKEYEDAVAVYDKLANEYQKVRTAFNKYVRSSEFRSDPDEVSKKKFDWLRNKMDTAEKRMQDAERDVNKLKEKGMGDVADAPFKNNYHEYVLKRLLRMAAEEGYDSIGWTPSEIQSKRWSEDYAEAYRIEYDQEMPKFLRKYGKKWGATVGNSYIRNTSIDRNYYEEQIADIESEIEQYRDELDDDNTEDYNIFIQEGISDLQNTLSNLYKELRGEKIWSMDITDTMKESVLYEGQTKYSHKADKKASYSGADTSNLIGKDMMLYEEGDRKPDLTLVEVYNERTGKTETTVKFVGDKPKNYIPQKVAYCYKLFEQHPDGTLHALFAGASNATPIGEWQFAQGFPYSDSGVKGMNLRERYGWHLSAGLPSAPHLMSSKAFERGYPSKNAFGHPKGSKRVWVRMAYDASTDFNSLADSTKGGDIFGLIPFGGYYAFKENNQSEWVISSAVKIDKILTEDERQQILKDAGYDEYEAWRRKHRATEAEKAESKRKSAENKKAKDRAKKEGLNYLSESAKEMREAIKSRIVVNPELSGIKYQHQATNSVKPRTLLVNALETAVSEEERNLLQTYKDNIDKLNAEQEKLEKVMEEADKIQFRKSLSISGEEMSVATFERRAKAKAEKNGINVEDVQFKLDRSNSKYIAYAVGKGTILEAVKTFRSAEDNAKLKELNAEAKEISAQINAYDRELLRLRAMQPIKDVLNREKAMAYKRASEKAEQIRKASVEKVRESAAKTEAKVKLQQLILKTSKWISYPGKDDVKCPDILRSPYAEFLKGIDLSSKRLLNGGEPTHNDERVANAMNNLANAIERITNAQNPSVDTDKVLDSGYLDLPVEFVAKLREMAESISKLIVGGDYVINRMSATDVKQLTKLIRTLNHAIKEMSTLYANLRFANVEALGDSSMSFLESMGEAKGENAVTDFVTWDNALPYYAFKRFGEGGESIFEGLMDGQDKLARLAKEIFEFKDKTWTDKESKEWGEDTHTITLPSGNTLTLTTADAMGIYCLSRREQGRQHLLGGGTRVLGIKKGAKKATDSRSTLTQEDIDAIVESLNDRQKKVALDIQKFMSEVCSEWGNEVSMKRFLTKEFTDPNYYPIESNDENLSAKDPQAQQSDLYRLLNISATKPLAPGANNEVIIRNIFDVFIEHASDMAKLNAYGLALLDYMKWVNYREKSVNENGQINVRGVHKAMIRTYGDKSWSYVLNLIKDVNGRHNDNGDNTFLMNMMRMQKTASVGNNLRVAFLQFTSYPRAALVLSNKSLALGLTKKPQMEKAKKYCGIALWKSYGFYDTNIARSIEDQLKGTTDIRQKLIELTMKGPEYADAITWGALWNACEYEVAKTTKNKVGSEEFYQEVGLKLREVVYATQVVDSILTRSQIMRSKSGLTQTATAYMSEPTLTANIVMDAGFQFQKEKRISGSAKTAWKNAGKYVVGAVGNYIILQLITSIAESLADAWRDDDEEEFLEKFGEAFGENLITNLIPFNKIPIISDIADLLLSFFGVGFVSSDNLSTSWLTQTANTVKAWTEVLGEEFGGDKTSKTLYNAIYQTAKAISSLTGVSVSGAMREVVAVWNNTAGAYDSSLKIRQYDLTEADKRTALYKAILAGDEKKIKNLEAEYEDQSDIDSAIRKALRENDPRIKEAAEAFIEGDYNKYNSLREEIISEGHFSRQIVTDALKAEYNYLKKKAEEDK